MITETEVIDEIKVDDAGRMFVRKTTIISKNGIELTRAHHRWTLDSDAEPDESFPIDIVEQRLAAASAKAKALKNKKPAPPNPKE